MLWVAVGLGGAIGSLLRFVLSFYLGANHWLTLAINVSGCFLLGVIYAWFSANLQENLIVQSALTSGFCGGFTTFSTFSLEALTLLNAGLIFKAIIYIVLSIVLGLTAVYGGIYFINRIYQC